MNIEIKGDKTDNKYEIFIAGNKDTRNIRKKERKHYIIEWLISKK